MLESDVAHVDQLGGAMWHLREAQEDLGSKILGRQNYM